MRDVVGFRGYLRTETLVFSCFFKFAFLLARSLFQAQTCIASVDGRRGSRPHGRSIAARRLDRAKGREGKDVLQLCRHERDNVEGERYEPVPVSDLARVQGGVCNGI